MMKEIEEKRDVMALHEATNIDSIVGTRKLKQAIIRAMWGK